MNCLKVDTPADQLYLKGLAIRHEQHIGKWLPIMWHLALRGHAGAMIELADWFSNDGSADPFGTPANAFSAAGYIDAHTNEATCVQPSTWR